LKIKNSDSRIQPSRSLGHLVLDWGFSISKVYMIAGGARVLLHYDLRGEEAPGGMSLTEIEKALEANGHS
jgi:hypothetical protein